MSDFYTKSDGNPSSWCKECVRSEKRKKYVKRRPDGVMLDINSDRIVEKKGCSIRIFWNKQMIDDLKRYFPFMTNDEVAGIIGVSHRTAVRKARELGLEKDKDWLLKKWGENRILANVMAKKKGYPGAFQKGCHNNPDGEFKPGHKYSPELEAKRVASIKEFFKIKHKAKSIWKGQRQEYCQ